MMNESAITDSRFIWHPVPPPSVCIRCTVDVRAASPRVRGFYARLISLLNDDEYQGINYFPLIFLILS